MIKLTVTFKLIFLTLFTLLSFSSLAIDQRELNQYLSQLPSGTHVSLLVQTTDNSPKTILSHNAQEFKTPASVEKLVTALAAQLSLGPNYRFKTELLTNGSIKQKQLSGNLILKMSGDPSFKEQDLNKMIAQLKAKGVTKITGNLIIDTSVFGSHDSATGWAWNNLTACYNAPPSAAIVDGNCFYAGIQPHNNIGGKASVSIGARYPVDMTIDVKTISNKSKSMADKYCELDIVHSAKNRYHLSGCIKHSSQKVYLKFGVQDGADYVARMTRLAFKKNNIDFRGKVIESKQPTTGKLTLIASHQSAPLSDLITVMLKKSDNLYADTIFRTIGAKYYNVPGTWQNASDAVKAILKNQAGIDLGNSVIIDGSGLSRMNLISAEKLMAVLQYIAKNDKQLNLISKLPISGVDGTLQNRRSLKDEPTKAKVLAKTGYLSGHYNMAGFIQRNNGDYLAFVQLVGGYNAHNTSGAKNKAMMDFEKNLYQSLIK